MPIVRGMSVARLYRYERVDPRDDHALGRLALSCLSAALAWLTTYPFELWPLAVVCWVPFVVAISQAGTREAIVLGAANGALLNALAFRWLVDALVRGAGVSVGQALLLFGLFVEPNE
jgi:apolipoprotein N-acyltransferase